MIKLTEEITKYLDYCKYQKKLNDKTIKAYSIDLTQFRHQMSVANCTEKSEISKYITFLHKTFSPKTAKRKLASVKAFYSYMEFDEIISDNPIKRLKTKFQEPQVLPRTIPVKSIEKIIAVTYGKLTKAKTMYESQTAYRNIAVVELLFATGVRVSELCSLNLSDVNLDDGNIRIMGKGAKERMLQIGNVEVLFALREYAGLRRHVTKDADAFFVNKLRSRLSEQSVRFMIRDCCTEAAVPLHV
ncbi:MAG: tyrosine-type recombinase/integrase, partial [Oscillospiraceae bacterium]|nr:tyrosine-type recombinase/integrase [Oscillospiraceae bacterium]